MRHAERQDCMPRIRRQRPDNRNRFKDKPDIELASRIFK